MDLEQLKEVVNDMLADKELNSTDKKEMLGYWLSQTQHNLLTKPIESDAFWGVMDCVKYLQIKYDGFNQ